MSYKIAVTVAGLVMVAAKTHINEFHGKFGHVIEFAGFELPAWYGGINAECMAVRNGVGLFDVSHMGRALIAGENAERFLDYVSTNNVASVSRFGGHYSLICNPQGGIKDDVVLLRLERDLFLMVYNASNREKDFSWLQQNATSYGVEVKDISNDVAMLALQGPCAESTLSKLCPENLSEIPRFGCRWIELSGLKCLASRTGYTGEDGFEIFVWDSPVSDPQLALKAWNAALGAGKEFGIEPCGLGARDILRLEAAMCLYGNDMDETVTPFEARLGFTVKLEKKDFVGKEPLVKQRSEGVKRIRIGLKMIDKGIPRLGCEILKDSMVIGKVTSGTLSPTVKVGIAMGYVPPEFSGEGEVLMIKIRDRFTKAQVVKFPFFDTQIYGRTRLARAG